MKEYRRICANINLKALEHNLDAIHGCIERDTKIIAVVKADGYGHGAVPLAEVMEQREDIWGYAVATPEEAEELYSNGIKKPILILGYTFPEYDEQIVKEGLRPAVFSLERAKQLSEEALRQNKECKIHIKLDTGMSRIGFQVTEQSADEIAQIAALPNIIIEGIFTHFSKADETDKTFTKKQADTYEQMITWLKDRQIEIPIHHVSNSAGIVDLPEYNKDIVRAGIILYGYPQIETNLKIKPVMEVKSKIVLIKSLKKGESVSYGMTFKADKDTKIALIPIGYADGIPRKLSNNWNVKIKNKYYPVRGRICMDLMIIEIFDDKINIEDDVLIFGNDKELNAENMAKKSETISYEILTNIGERVKRVYKD